MSVYRELWRLPGAPRLLIAGTVARLGYGITIVAWVLLVEAASNSFTRAGAVAATLSLATAVAAPVAGRLADRVTARRLLPWFTVLYVATQVILLAGVLAGLATGVLVLIAAVSGALFPPVTPALRAAWTRMTVGPHADLRTAAMAAESTVFEMVFVLGPLLLSATVLAVTGGFAGSDDVTGIATAIALACVFTLLGTLALCRGLVAENAESNPAGRSFGGIGPLRKLRFDLLLAIAAGVAFSFGAAPVAVAAFADARTAGDTAPTAGVLIAVWSLGSAAGGLLYGTLVRPSQSALTLSRRSAAMTTALAVGYGVWLLAPSVTVLAVVMTLTGAVIAPTTAVLAELVAVTVDDAELTESYTWFTAVNMSLAALGAAVAGALADIPRIGVAAAIGSCGCAVAISALVAVGVSVRTVWRSERSAAELSR